MGYNIEWADPEVTECWSYQGRLYQSYNKAKIERDRKIKYREECRVRYPDRDFSWWGEITPIYKVKWDWEEVDG